MVQIHSNRDAEGAAASKGIKRRAPAGMHEQGKVQAFLKSAVEPRMAAKRFNL